MGEGGVGLPMLGTAPPMVSTEGDRLKGSMEKRDL